MTASRSRCSARCRRFAHQRQRASANATTCSAAPTIRRTMTRPRSSARCCLSSRCCSLICRPTCLNTSYAAVDFRRKPPATNGFRRRSLRAIVTWTKSLRDGYLETRNSRPCCRCPTGIRGLIPKRHVLARKLYKRTISAIIFHQHTGASRESQKAIRNVSQL